jgi:pyruvate/2-oxoglutarate dehydrogenase complex dihydrolipoamide dehydrogenase (E3) component
LSQHFDAIVTGTGQAGPSLAARFAAAGKKIAIIERHKFGGTWVNTGCIPTKTMAASAYVAHVARRGAEYGFSVNGDVRQHLVEDHAEREDVAARIRLLAFELLW